jgi:hypothetical protein
MAIFFPCKVLLDKQPLCNLQKFIACNKYCLTGGLPNLHPAKIPPAEIFALQFLHTRAFAGKENTHEKLRNAIEMVGK